MTRVRPGVAVLAALAALAPADPASAHVKWFAPYIVGAPPAPITRTLGDGWFWLGIGLVLAFFTLTRLVERGTHGPAVLTGLDRLTQAIWERLDDYVRAITAAFFVAIFSVGGVYLTPDLKTPAEWVSWVQLLIAAAIFWRATLPLAGAGIVGLWLLALRDYDLFHLFNYLALGLGVATYLILAAQRDEPGRAGRGVVRVGFQLLGAAPGVLRPQRACRARHDRPVHPFPQPGAPGWPRDGGRYRGATHPGARSRVACITMPGTAWHGSRNDAPPIRANLGRCFQSDPLFQKGCSTPDSPLPATVARYGRKRSVKPTASFGRGAWGCH